MEQKMAEVKTDCFGYVKAKAESCTALRKLYCANEECPFYKPKEQHLKEVEATRKRLGGECEY